MPNAYINDFNETVRAYYEQLRKKSNPISRKKEEELLSLAKQGNLEARNKVLEVNCRFVFDTAKKFSGKGASMDDLISEGNMGMIKAIERFDQSHGVKFITYAVWYIRQAMQDFVKHRQTIQSNENDEESMPVVERHYTPDEEDEGESVCYVETVADEKVDEEDELRREVHVKKLANTLMSGLEGREKEFIELRYGLTGNTPMTLEMIGGRYGISKERVRQVCVSAIRRMKGNALLLPESFATPA